MRAHPVNLLVAVLVSALLTYGMANVDANAIQATLAVGSFIFLSCTLGTAIGLEFDQSRTAVNLKTLAGVYFAIGLAVQLVFSFCGFSQTSYVVTNGVAFLTFVLFANTIYRAQQ